MDYHFVSFLIIYMDYHFVSFEKNSWYVISCCLLRSFLDLLSRSPAPKVSFFLKNFEPFLQKTTWLLQKRSQSQQNRTTMPKIVARLLIKFKFCTDTSSKSLHDENSSQHKFLRSKNSQKLPKIIARSHKSQHDLLFAPVLENCHFA